MGMRQRLGVARCLLADPLLLILDEPTNGLDPGGIQEFREMIRAMVEQEGRTVFISSHLLDEVEKTCDAAAIVDRGKVIVQGSIAELAQGGGVRNELILGVDDVELALTTLSGASELVRDVRRADEGLRVELDGDPQTALRSTRPRAGGSGRHALGARAPQPRAALWRSRRGWMRPRAPQRGRRCRGGDGMSAVAPAAPTTRAPVPPDQGVRRSRSPCRCSARTSSSCARSAAS